MKREIRAGNLRVNALIFWDPSRFARDLPQAIQELGDLRALGIRLRFSDSLYGYLNGADPMVEIRLYEAFLRGAEERARLIHRTRLGLLEAQFRGRQVGRLPAFFTQTTRSKLRPTREAVEACKRRLAGQSWGEIADGLNMTRQDARNIVRFVGKKASDVLART